MALKSFFEKRKADWEAEKAFLKTMPRDVLNRASNWAGLAVVLGALAVWVAIVNLAATGPAPWGAVVAVIVLLAAAILARRKGNEIVAEWEDTL